MGGFRLRIGLNLKKWYTWFILLFIGLFYAMYYLMLAVLWILYGIAWCLYKLGVWWIALFKTLQKGWQKGALVGGTALLVALIAVIGGSAGSKQNAPATLSTEPSVESVTYDSAYAMAQDLFDDDSTSVVSASSAIAATTTTKQTTTTATTTTTSKTTTTSTTTKLTTTTSTTKAATTNTTKPTTTTSTTKPTTTTTTTKPTTERTTSPTVVHQTSSSYVLNTNTKRIHYPSCSSVDKILPENYSETNDYNAAIQAGYRPCGNCHPQ